MNQSPGYYEHLTFNAPLSDERADRLVRRLAASGPREVIDVGCGWGELLIRLLEHATTTLGTGVDTDDRVLDRGRATAVERGVAARVSFANGTGSSVRGPADAVICVGSSQAFGDTAREALVAMHGVVRPGGRLLLGEPIWDGEPPRDPSLVWEDVLNLPDLGGLVDMAVAVGYRPLHIEAANADEWNDFESGYLADLETWLMTHSGHEDADEIRGQADEHRRRWLNGYRGGLGFAYLTLGVPAA